MQLVVSILLMPIVWLNVEQAKHASVIDLHVTPPTLAHSCCVETWKLGRVGSWRIHCPSASFDCRVWTGDQLVWVSEVTCDAHASQC
jgi:hypothetical protein